MTQEELSEYIRVSSHAVSRWENGITYPDISLLPILADIFEVDVDKLLDVYKKNNILPVYLQKTKQNLNSGICPRYGVILVEELVHMVNSLAVTIIQIVNSYIKAKLANNQS